MFRIHAHGKSRVAASLVSSLGLMAAAGAVSTGPAQSVEPAGDCPTAYPMAELITAVDAGEIPAKGRTVSRGTVPEDFTGSVFGVVDNGIAPGLDMIMADLTSPALTEAGGVWAGMSGSPVYDAADGRLIGAVAYGLSAGPSSIAGITPYEAMAKHLVAPTTVAATLRVDLSRQEAAQVATESGITRSEAAQGFTRLPMPRSFVGIRGALLNQAATQAPPGGKRRPYVARKAEWNVAQSHGVRASAADASDLLAGGNLGATLSHGDITIGSVGTVTAVCGNRLVGFGHPMTFSGRTSLGLNPASAVYVQPDTVGTPFKVANIAEAAGTIDQDRSTGISGKVGEGTQPPTTSVTSDLTYLGTSRQGTTHVYVPDARAQITFYQQLVNHDALIDGIQPGSELQHWTIEGTENGERFTITHSDRFTSHTDIAFESPWDVADAVLALSGMPGVAVDSVVVKGQVVDDHSTWRLVGMRQRRAGGWTTLTQQRPAVVSAGSSLDLGAVLAKGTVRKTIQLSVDVPRRARGQGFLGMSGGGSSWTWLGGADTVTKLKQRLSRMVRNDKVEARLYLETRHGGVRANRVSDASDTVVLGYREAPVIVR